VPSVPLPNNSDLTASAGPSELEQPGDGTEGTADRLLEAQQKAFDAFYDKHLGNNPHPDPHMESMLRRTCGVSWSAGVIWALTRGALTRGA